MYWYYKLFFGIVAVGIIGLIGWSLRGFIPSLPEGKDEPAERVEVAPIPPPVAINTGSTEASPTEARSGSMPNRGTPTATPPANDPMLNTIREKLRLAEQHLADDDPVAARKVAEATLKLPEIQPYSEAWIQTAELLGKINTQIMLTDVPSEEKVTYTVEKGDSVWGISKKLNVTMSMVMLGNRIDPDNATVFPGQTLKIYKGDWNVLINKSHYILQLRDSDRLVKIYHVGTGRQDRTPVGQFRITTKERNPTWHFRGKKYPFGHKENVLGTRWMGLEPVGDTNALLEGYGIHGTNEPSSIGGQESNGCIRMLNEDVEELFNIVPYHTPVIIAE